MACDTRLNYLSEVTTPCYGDYLKWGATTLAGKGLKLKLGLFLRKIEKDCHY